MPFTYTHANSSDPILINHLTSLALWINANVHNNG